MKPKGTLIAIGGNEEKEITKIERFNSEHEEGIILKNIIKQAGGKKCRIEVLTSGSQQPEEVGEEYCDIFSRLGVEYVNNLIINERDISSRSSIHKRIEEADAILFSGGDQSQISFYLKDTNVHKLIYDKYFNEDFVIAGTSAGAVVMAEEMIAGGRNYNVLKKSDLKLGEGLGLIKQAIFDSHFFRRNRFGRLAEAVALYPDKLGVGLGEDTGLIIKEGNICEVIGTGMVVLFDGSSFTYNEARKLKNNKPISLSNLKVHVLAPKDKYYIHEKKAEIYQDPQNFN